jgi:hypothetical protein
MKPSSISLWSIGFLAAAALPAFSAEAWWRDRAYVDNGLVIESYPPGYLEDRGVVVYPPAYQERHIYRRPRTVYVDPGYDDGPTYYDRDAEPYAPETEALPVRPAKPQLRQRSAGMGAGTDPADGAAAPRVVPGVAPRKPSSPGPKIVTVKPLDLGTRPAANPAAEPDVTASIALPVPRPNLEGMDFAPAAKPNAEINPPTTEDRR